VLVPIALASIVSGFILSLEKPATLPAINKPVTSKPLTAHFLIARALLFIGTPFCQPFLWQRDPCLARTIEMVI
jgi:hypothetical protein